MRINSTVTTVAILLAILAVSLLRFLPDDIRPGVIIGVGLSFAAVGWVELKNWIDGHPQDRLPK